MWYFFLWIWLFSKCNPAIFVTLHWKHCFHLCMDDVYFLFRFTRPKNTDQTNYYLFNQPTNQPTYRPPPAQMATRIGPELLLKKSGIQGSNLFVIIYILIEPTLIFAISYIAFLYSFDLFCWFFLLMIIFELPNFHQIKEAPPTYHLQTPYL